MTQDAPVLDATRPSDGERLLEVRDLRTSFITDDGIVGAVDGVSFSVAPGKTLGIVGESGCGKSVTMLTVMGLNPKKTARSSGEALLKGEDLIHASSRRLREVRGNEIAMIFQDPMTSLNPVHKIGTQLIEAILLHRDVSTSTARARALEVLKEVGIPQAARRLDDYPHQFSGGMRQRVMIAMALACEPAVLLADEPTTALDVTIQAQVLGLLADLKERHGMAMLFITHNLGVVAQIADRVAVMYAGQIVEQAPVAAIFARPAHPYTRALFAAIPRMDRDAQDLAAIPGRVPPLDAMPTGCRFAPRCPLAQPGCEQPQVLGEVGPRHLARCHVATGVRPGEHPLEGTSGIY